MKSQAIARAAALASLAGLALAGLAEARNPHCAGGIQYVVQAMRDKDRGNIEDYDREIKKAVEQLEKCAAEDPKDFEAIGYLGWAYAEVESAGPAGEAFARAIAGLQAKGDRRKAETVTNNRNSFWARAFNEGIGKMQTSQQIYPDYCKKPEHEADETLRGEAKKRFDEAEMSLQNATLLRPGDPQTIRNLATVYALQCDFQKAEAVLRDGLKQVGSDTLLQEALRTVRINYAAKMTEEKRYDEALAFYTELAKAEPKNADLYVWMADVYFRRAQSLEGDARKAEFKLAGESYAQAAQLRTDDADLTFNAGLSFQNAQVWDKAEALWAKTAKSRPDDVDALSAWGATLVELKRCDQAIETVHRAVSLRPKDRNLHRQLGAIYTRCGNNARGTDALMVYLAMQNGAPVADVAATAKTARQGTDAGKTLASEGVPDEIYSWEADNQKFETWFYWSKKRAYAFTEGGLSRKSDWTSAETRSASGAKP